MGFHGDTAGSVGNDEESYPSAMPGCRHGKADSSREPRAQAACDRLLYDLDDRSSCQVLMKVRLIGFCLREDILKPLDQGSRRVPPPP